MCTGDQKRTASASKIIWQATLMNRWKMGALLFILFVSTAICLVCRRRPRRGLKLFSRNWIQYLVVTAPRGRCTRKEPGKLLFQFIFAYGQTSSGKTFTMTGITEYTLADIYDYIQKHTEREFILKFSAMEIYNECVRDHLSTDSTPLRLLDDPEVNSFSFNTGIHMFLLHDSYLLRKRGTIVEKLTKETLRDWNHVMVLLSICEGSVMHSSVANPREPTVGQSIGQTTPAALGNENSAQPATVGAAGSSPSIRRSEVRVVPLRTAITN